MKIIAFGEVLWDVIDGNYHLGGAPLNFASHSFKNGISSGILSAYGNDELGRKSLEAIKKLNVDTDLLQVVKNNPTGVVNVEVTNGQPSYFIKSEVAYDYINFNQIDINKISEYKALYFGTLAQRSIVSRDCLRQILSQFNFEFIFCDINLRQNFYSHEVLDFSFNNCTILKLNDEEADIVSDLIFGKKLSLELLSEALSEKYSNISVIIITKGAEGCLVFEKCKFVSVPSQPIVVKDTIGAGDSFSAAFCSVYFKSKDVKLAATFANKVAGFVASKSGAIPDYELGQ
ncbi:MAG: carbohydrate kinase [Flavobacteriales bacterium]|jgi:fructokinase